MNYLERLCWHYVGNRNLRDTGNGATTILTIGKHKRFAMRQAARLICAGNRPCAGLLVEVSLDGCRLALADSDSFSVEQSITVEISHFAKLRAQVRWSGNGFVGLRFDHPLHTAELDELLQTCRPEQDSGAAMRGYGT